MGTPLSADDFPSSFKPVVHLPKGSHATNVVVFLPGLGDTAINFSSFARALNLPDALVVTLNPPFPLPLAVSAGGQWSEDLQIDSSSGALDPESPLDRAVEMVAQGVIVDLLATRRKYRPDHIHLFGFGQGGSVALAVPLHASLSSCPPLGGVMALGGGLLLSLSPNSSSAPPNETLVLLLSGRNSPLAATDSSPLKRVKSAYKFVTYHPWRKNDDSLPRSRDEVVPMMQFWSRTLKSRRGVPSDAIEIG